jgi:hypothetical protein
MVSYPVTAAVGMIDEILQFHAPGLRKPKWLLSFPEKSETLACIDGPMCWGSRWGLP